MSTVSAPAHRVSRPLHKPDAAEAAWRGRGEWVVAAGIRLTVAAVLAQTLMHLTLNVALRLDVYFVDVNGEQNLPAWLSSVTVFSCAAACVLLAVVVRAAMIRLLVVGAVLAFLSLDEFAMIHETLSQRVLDAVGGSSSWESLVWPVLYLPILAAVVVVLVTEARRSPWSSFPLVVAAFACLGVAVGADMVSSLYESSGPHPYQLEGAVEEAFELAGWGLLATALFSWFASDPGAAFSGPPMRSNVSRS